MSLPVSDGNATLDGPPALTSHTRSSSSSSSTGPPATALISARRLIRGELCNRSQGWMAPFDSRAEADDRREWREEERRGLVACANSASLPVKVKTARSRDCKCTVSIVVAFNNSAPLPHWWHLHEWQHSCGIWRTDSLQTHARALPLWLGQSRVLLVPSTPARYQGEITGC